MPGEVLFVRWRNPTPHTRHRISWSAIARRGPEARRPPLRPRTKLGNGRARLLELIDERGSIQKAVARMGMSYRDAWGSRGVRQDAVARRRHAGLSEPT